jgi:protoporphyrinogen oxidase
LFFCVSDTVLTNFTEAYPRHKNTAMKERITIIGGGITGLSAAYLAAKDGWDVTLLEGSSQVGGLMRTFKIGGNRLEFYYHHFFKNDEELFWLLGELGLRDRLEFRKTTMGIFRDEEIFDFNSPMDLIEFAPMGVVDKVRFLISSLYMGKLARWHKWENVASLDWFYKYAGEKTTDLVWRPLLEIKFGPYAKSVPAAWMVGRLKQRMNSRKGTEEQLGYIKGSVQVLTDALTKRLIKMGVKIKLNACVQKLQIKNKALCSIETTTGSYNDGIFLATLPTTYLVPLLREHAPDYAVKLARIEYIGAVCTILELDHPLTDIYWLNIADAGYPFGGVIEHTNFIPPEEYNGRHIVYLSKYYANSDPLATASKGEIVSRMLEPLNKINPKFGRTWIKNVYVFRTSTAATACVLNFSDLVPPCKTPIKNLYLVTMSHIYPDERSCNNAIRIAAMATRKIGINSSMVPFGTSLSGQIGME